jgi:ABC-type branched-subunit amino acid transport system ATPase component/branched-subunit amino acid ABC-type transport system permease component
LTTERRRVEQVVDRVTSFASQDESRFGIQLTIGALAFFVFVGILYPAPMPILFLGIVLGSLSALVAMGLVLIYRANRIVNFAQGDLGGVASVLAASLIVGPKWGFFPAVIVGLITAVAIGAITERTFIRRFAKAPRLILTVATIGIQQIFAGIQLALPKLFDYDIAPQPPAPWQLRWEWFPVTFNAGHVLILIVVPLVTIGLIAFFRYTDVGIAVRAQAESQDRAALLGIPVKRIGTLVWMIAAGMSGLGVLLRLPIQGVQIGAVLGPSLMLRALAAAVIGRMESLPVTFGAALVLGMVEQAVLFVTGRTIIVDAVMFFVIIAALLFQRRQKLSRADDAGVSTWAAIREVRPIPRELAKLPEVRWALVVGGVLIAAFLLFAPLAMSEGTINLFGVGLIGAMIIVSLVILTGWSGQISLGHLSFVAFGAAVAGSLAQQGKDFFLSLIVAALVGAGIAMAVGIPALRIRGLFLAVTTLAFAVTTGTYFLNEEFFPWLVPDPGVRVLRPTAVFDKFNFESEHTFYYFLLLMMLLVIGAVWSLRHSRTGRALVAVRDNSRAAQAYGINRVRAELTAFGLAGFLAALAGGVFVYHQHGISRSVLETPGNLRVFSIAVIGGLGSIPGALFGAAYQTFLDYSPFTRVPESQYFASGAGLLFILLVFPAGLGGLLYDIRDSLLRRVARRREIVVPSLLADVRVLEEGEGGTVLTQVKHRKHREHAPRDSLLSVQGLDVSYGKTQVLFDVDFHVDQGEIVALLGTNGAGKSTLLSAIAGTVTPGEGAITFDGEDITKAGPNETVAKGVVLMPGSRGVFPSLSVEENLRLAAWLYRKDPEYVRTATEQVLGYFPVLRERWKQKAGNLSGGEQQMLTLGQVFLARPKVLMIDELSLGLAPVVVGRLLDIVRAINANGTAIVLVEQSVNVAITLAERAVFLEKGEVRFEGGTADLLDRPDILRAVFLKGHRGGPGGLPPEKGRSRKPAYEAVCEHCGREHGVALTVSELSVSFGGIRAVEDVSFGVREGQIVGIIGPNGAGKTTVFDLISGFVVPSSGAIRLEDHDITELGPDARARLGLGRSFQDARLFPAMTVRQAIATALERHIDVADPIAAFVMSAAVRASERKTSAEVDRLIDQLNLHAFADKFVGELSTGTRRIVDIACSLAHDPKVLLLDEPSSGLAQRETEALGPVILDIRERTGAAIVVIEHDIPLITAVSDELVALELGRVIATGEPRAVINHPAVVEGYLGSSEAAITRSGRRTGPQGRHGRRANGRRPAKKKKKKARAARKPAAARRGTAQR